MKTAGRKLLVDRLQARLKELDLSQNDLACLVGVNQSSVSRSVQRGDVPDGEAMYVLCATLGVTAAYLFGDADELTADPVAAPAPFRLRVPYMRFAVEHRAREDLTAFLAKLVDRHELSYGELMSALAVAMQDIARDLVLEERGDPPPVPPLRRGEP